MFFKLEGKRNFLINTDKIVFVEDGGDGFSIWFGDGFSIRVTGEDIDSFDTACATIIKAHNDR